MPVLLREVVSEPPRVGQLTQELQAVVPEVLGCTYRAGYRLLSVVVEGSEALPPEVVEAIDGVLAAHVPQIGTDG